jgi:hypothetical protein
MTTTERSCNRLLMPMTGEPGEYMLEIDSSTFENRTCEKRWEYAALYKRQLGVKSPALTAGAALHAGLEPLYRCGFTADSHNQGIEMACKVMFDEPVPHDEWRTADRVVDTLNRYVAKWTPDNLQPLLDEGGYPLVERKFRLPLAHIPVGRQLAYDDYTLFGGEMGRHSTIENIHVYWTGRIDLVAKFDGLVWVVDHKTSSYGQGDSFFSQFKLSQQMIGYHWAAQQLYNVEPVGVLINLIYWRPPVASGSYRTEFERQRFPYPEWLVSEWKANTVVMVSDLVSCLVRSNFPRFYPQCVGKYGKCPYLDVCSLPPEQRTSFLASDIFTDITWNPLD